MGKAQSKLSHEQLQELQKSTYFDRKELQQWYKDFLKDCPSGHMTKAEYQRIFKQFFPFGDPSGFAEYVFNAFDTSSNGTIDFKDFICALSVTARGSIEEKIKWSFQLYDQDHDGRVSYTEMVAVVDAIYRMVGSMMKLPADEATAEKRVAKIFAAAGKDRRDALSPAEFGAVSQQDPTVVSALTIYDGLV
ncbi:uncharacterized protein V1510DRAFT_109488 [Dipodascopsis tothii]|uniref:uncharacterized protein n=1 Tax=Dipodascopsis tothii TaxID=44089 RepID=UPI0034CEA17D